MKKSTIAILIILLISGLFAFFAVTMTGNVSRSTYADNNAGNCIETDYGPYEKIPGSVTYETWYGAERTLADSCNKEKGSASERACKGKRVITKTFVCKNGCNAEGTACEGTHWQISDVESSSEDEASFSLAFKEAEPGDEFVFLVSNEDESNAETNPLALEVTPPEKEEKKPSAQEFCKWFVFQPPKLEKLQDEKVSVKIPFEAYAPNLSAEAKKEQENAWGADSGCFYKTTFTLDSPDSFTLGNALDDKIMLMQKMYRRYCTGSVADMPLKLSVCRLPKREGIAKEVDTGFGGILKISISLDGKKK